MPTVDHITSTVELQSGETLGLGAIEITSIPHASILQKRYSVTPNIDAEYKQDMARLLSELFQSYKHNFIAGGCYKDIALELLWCTEEVKNQPYKANIKLYLIVRAIDDSVKAVENAISSFLRICRATLDLDKYEYRGISFGDLAPRIQNIDDTSICAIVKEERIENLQNQILPSCYSFDRISPAETSAARCMV